MAEASRTRIAIVGGGVTGLSAAYQANQLGHDVVLFEASPRLGGKVQTESRDGFLVETGPDSFVVGKNSVLELATELGIDHEIISTRPDNGGARVWREGRLHPLPEGLMLMAPSKLRPLFGSSLLSWKGKIRVLGDLLVRRRSGDDESLESFVIRRMGREVLERIAEPLIAGIHAAEPATMSLRASFPRFLDMEDRDRSLILAARRATKRRSTVSGRSHFASFRNGMGQLTSALVDGLEQVEVRISVPVTAIAPGRAGYRLTSGDGQNEAFDGVVVAAPSDVAARLVESLSPDAAAAIREIRRVSTATVTLAYRTSEIPELVGTGFVVPSAERRRIMGVSFLSNKWEGRVPDEGHVLMRAFIGGAHGRELALAEEDRILATTRRELTEMLGIEADPLFSRVASWEGGLHQYRLGHIDRVGRAEKALASHPGVVLAGAAFHGVGLNECVASGRRAARLVATSER